MYICISSYGTPLPYICILYNRPGVAQRVSGGLGSQISWHSAREGGEVVSLTLRPPLPQECSWYSFSLGAESTPGPRYGRKLLSLKKPVTSPGIDPGTVRLVAQRLNHYATPGPIYSFIHSVICLTTGPTPLPKRFLHIVRSRASSFKR